MKDFLILQFYLTMNRPLKHLKEMKLGGHTIYHQQKVKDNVFFNLETSSSGDPFTYLI